jgi:hypothetical protein
MESSFWRDLAFAIFLSPLLFLLVTIALKCLLVSCYLWLLYYAVRAAKKPLRVKLGVRGATMPGIFSCYACHFPASASTAH